MGKLTQGGGGGSRIVELIKNKSGYTAAQKKVNTVLTPPVSESVEPDIPFAPKKKRIASSPVETGVTSTTLGG